MAVGPGSFDPAAGAVIVAGTCPWIRGTRIDTRVTRKNALASSRRARLQTKGATGRLSSFHVLVGEDNSMIHHFLRPFDVGHVPQKRFADDRATLVNCGTNCLRQGK